MLGARGPQRSDLKAKGRTPGRSTLATGRPMVRRFDPSRGIWQRHFAPLLPSHEATGPPQRHEGRIPCDGYGWDAEGFAEAHGGSLVTINDSGEQVWLAETFTRENLLIGLNDSDVDGTFVWANGDVPTNTNWVPDEPND
jgi:hypothetical protein